MMMGSDEMDDREKVTKGLKTCMSEELCTDCPYYERGTDCTGCLMEDVFGLLKEQEKKIKSLERTIEDICCGGRAG